MRDKVSSRNMVLFCKFRSKGIDVVKGRDRLQKPSAYEERPRGGKRLHGNKYEAKGKPGPAANIILAGCCRVGYPQLSPGLNRLSPVQNAASRKTVSTMTHRPDALSLPINTL